MKEGFLLNGVHIFRDEFTVDQTTQDALSVFSDAADAPVSGLDPAAMSAEMAPYVVSIQFPVQHGLAHHYFPSPI